VFPQKTIRPANGYCLFLPDRAPGKRFVAGSSVGVWPWEEWKHVKLGVFHVTLPGDQDLLITTSEGLKCQIRASFSIVVGGPEEGREERLAKATLSCPAMRSMKDEDRIELVPFFHDWARGYCRTAIVNTVKKCEYTDLLEQVDYRKQAQADIEAEAQRTLATIGMFLSQCTVILEPGEPSGPFATPAMLARWSRYLETRREAEIARLRSDNDFAVKKLVEDASHSREKQEIEEQAKREDAERKQVTELRLREISLETKRRETLFATDEQQELSKRDQRIGEIKEEMEKRAQTAQLQRIRREAELEAEQVRQKKEIDDLRSQHEFARLNEQQKLLSETKVLKERELEVSGLEVQLEDTKIELERKKGVIKAESLEKAVLAGGAHDRLMRELLLNKVPEIVGAASGPMERIGDIRIINMSGGAGAEGAGPGNLGAVLASASTLPIVRELFRFLNELEQPGPRPELAEPSDGVIRPTDGLSGRLQSDRERRGTD
jgi:hypothetical protein